VLAGEEVAADGCSSCSSWIEYRFGRSKAPAIDDTLRPQRCHTRVLFRAFAQLSIDSQSETREGAMLYAAMGYLHAAIVGRVRGIQRLAAGETGQGTVEYVGLILLVSLLMVGMVAAMKGFNS